MGVACLGEGGGQLVLQLVSAVLLLIWVSAWAGW